ncbi:MAG TPA: hydantoinase/oxoprolinase family protein [Conexibacter sp.]|nr:hydantoinase/oxoprolinase family protein [Conexibacter sp.]
MDIGGTFTDVVAYDEETGTYAAGKSSTTPHDLTEGVFAGLAQVVDSPASIGFTVHGTTVGLNAFLQRKGEKVLLLATSGAGDVYHIARGNRLRLYDVQYRKPRPLVPLGDIVEVGGRLDYLGEERAPLDEDAVRRAAARVRDEGFGAVAVGLLFSFLNPAHELRVEEILQEELGGSVAVSLSHRVAREWREYERTSSAVLEAYTAPVIRRYLERLQSEMTTQGLSVPLHVMQSSGGVVTADSARERPLQTLMSGPVGGTMGLVALARMLDRPNLIGVDMGGTSFDVSLVVGGKPDISTETALEGLPILMPIANIHTIGAGGGSLAYVEAGGLRVGPESAGADPGPACYGRGGTRPTVTDANLVLGRIDPDYFLGGRMQLDVEGARAGVARIAEATGLTLEQAADGIVQIANTHMAKAMRSILIERGYDPRDFVLYGFGGGGGLHTAAAMRELSIPHGVVPSNPGALSAIGMLGTDFRHDRARTLVRPVAELDADEVERIFGELEGEATTALVSEGLPESSVELTRSADLRYLGQEYHLSVPCPARGEPLDTDALATLFNREHERMYGYSTPDSPVQLVNLRLVGIGRTEGPALPRIARRSDGGAPQPRELRQVHFAGSGWTETPIYTVESVLAGDELPGPSILEDPRSTMLILPGQRGEIDELRNLHIHEVEE